MIVSYFHLFCSKHPWWYDLKSGRFPVRAHTHRHNYKKEIEVKYDTGDHPWKAAVPSLADAWASNNSSNLVRNVTRTWMEAQHAGVTIPAQEVLWRDYFVLINLICVYWTPGFACYHCGFQHNGQCAFKAMAKWACAPVTELHLVPGLVKQPHMQENTDMHTLLTPHADTKAGLYTGVEAILYPLI